METKIIESIEIEKISRILSKQIDKEIFKKKYTPAADVLKLVGLGVFLAGSFVVPNLPMALKPFIKDLNQPEPWKRFNIPYLKQTLKRLEKEKLVEVIIEAGVQIVKVTESGKRKVLRYALDELAVEIPKNWDYKWRLVSYDIPEELKHTRDIFKSYLKAWGFYLLHDSVFLHAYPCEDQVKFLREYLGIGEYVRVFIVSFIENDKPFREYFDI